jgi:hypothetical protein
MLLTREEWRGITSVMMMMAAEELKQSLFVVIAVSVCRPGITDE